MRYVRMTSIQQWCGAGAIASVGTLILLSPCLFGFPQHLKTYPGPPLSRARVALLARADQAVKIQAVDEKQVPGFNGQKFGNFEFLPGPHTVRVYFERYFDSGSERSEAAPTLRFDAQAGRVYLIVVDRDSGLWKPAVVEAAPGSSDKFGKMAEAVEGSFVEYRAASEPRLSPSPDAVLVNLHYLKLVAIDGVEGRYNAMTELFRFAPGPHSVTVTSIVRKGIAPATVEFEAAAGRVYALLEGGGMTYDPWAPKIADITDLMDNVMSHLVDSINKFLKK